MSYSFPPQHQTWTAEAAVIPANGNGGVHYGQGVNTVSNDVVGANNLGPIHESRMRASSTIIQESSPFSLPRIDTSNHQQQLSKFRAPSSDAPQSAEGYGSYKLQHLKSIYQNFHPDNKTIQLRPHSSFQTQRFEIPPLPPVPQFDTSHYHQTPIFPQPTDFSTEKPHSRDSNNQVEDNSEDSGSGIGFQMAASGSMPSTFNPRPNGYYPSQNMGQPTPQPPQPKRQLSKAPHLTVNSGQRATSQYILPPSQMNHPIRSISLSTAVTMSTPTTFLPISPYQNPGSDMNVSNSLSPVQYISKDWRGSRPHGDGAQYSDGNQPGGVRLQSGSEQNQMNSHSQISITRSQTVAGTQQLRSEMQKPSVGSQENRPHSQQQQYGQQYPQQPIPPSYTQKQPPPTQQYRKPLPLQQEQVDPPSLRMQIINNNPVIYSQQSRSSNHTPVPFPADSNSRSNSASTTPAQGSPYGYGQMQTNMNQGPTGGGGVTMAGDMPAMTFSSLPHPGYNNQSTRPVSTLNTSNVSSILMASTRPHQTHYNRSSAVSNQVRPNSQLSQNQLQGLVHGSDTIQSHHNQQNLIPLPPPPPPPQQQQQQQQQIPPLNGRQVQPPQYQPTTSQQGGPNTLTSARTPSRPLSDTQPGKLKLTPFPMFQESMNMHTGAPPAANTTTISGQYPPPPPPPPPRIQFQPTQATYLDHVSGSRSLPSSAGIQMVPLSPYANQFTLQPFVYQPISPNVPFTQTTGNLPSAQNVQQAQPVFPPPPTVELKPTISTTDFNPSFESNFDSEFSPEFTLYIGDKAVVSPESRLGTSGMAVYDPSPLPSYPPPPPPPPSMPPYMPQPQSQQPIQSSQYTPSGFTAAVNSALSRALDQNAVPGEVSTPKSQTGVTTRTTSSVLQAPAYPPPPPTQVAYSGYPPVHDTRASAAPLQSQQVNSSTGNVVIGLDGRMGGGNGGSLGLTDHKPIYQNRDQPEIQIKQPVPIHPPLLPSKSQNQNTAGTTVKPAFPLVKVQQAPQQQLQNLHHQTQSSSIHQGHMGQQPAQPQQSQSHYQRQQQFQNLPAQQYLLKKDNPPPVPPKKGSSHRKKRTPTPPLDALRIAASDSAMTVTTATGSFISTPGHSPEIMNARERPIRPESEYGLRLGSQNHNLASKTPGISPGDQSPYPHQQLINPLVDTEPSASALGFGGPSDWEYFDPRGIDYSDELSIHDDPAEGDAVIDTATAAAVVTSIHDIASTSDSKWDPSADGNADGGSTMFLARKPAHNLAFAQVKTVVALPSSAATAVVVSSARPSPIVPTPVSTTISYVGIDTEVQTAKAVIAAKQVLILELERALEERMDAISIKDAIILEKDQLLLQKAELIKGKDDRIRELEMKVAEMQTVTTALAKITESANLLEAQNKTLADLEMTTRNKIKMGEVITVAASCQEALGVFLHKQSPGVASLGPAFSVRRSASKSELKPMNKPVFNYEDWVPTALRLGNTLRGANSSSVNLATENEDQPLASSSKDAVPEQGRPRSQSAFVPMTSGGVGLTGSAGIGTVGPKLAAPPRTKITAWVDEMTEIQEVTEVSEPSITPRDVPAGLRVGPRTSLPPRDPKSQVDLKNLRPDTHPRPLSHSHSRLSARPLSQLSVTSSGSDPTSFVWTGMATSQAVLRFDNSTNPTPHDSDITLLGPLPSIRMMETAEDTRKPESSTLKVSQARSRSHSQSDLHLTASPFVSEKTSQPSTPAAKDTTPAVLTPARPVGSPINEETPSKTASPASTWNPPTPRSRTLSFSQTLLAAGSSCVGGRSAITQAKSVGNSPRASSDDFPKSPSRHKRKSMIASYPFSFSKPHTPKNEYSLKSGIRSNPLSPAHDRLISSPGLVPFRGPIRSRTTSVASPQSSPGTDKLQSKPSTSRRRSIPANMLLRAFPSIMTAVKSRSNSHSEAKTPPIRSPKAKGNARSSSESTPSLANSLNIDKALPTIPTPVQALPTIPAPVQTLAIPAALVPASPVTPNIGSTANRHKKRMSMSLSSASAELSTVLGENTNSGGPGQTPHSRSHSQSNDQVQVMILSELAQQSQQHRLSRTLSRRAWGRQNDPQQGDSSRRVSIPTRPSSVSNLKESTADRLEEILGYVKDLSGSEPLKPKHKVPSIVAKYEEMSKLEAQAALVSDDSTFLRRLIDDWRRGKSDSAPHSTTTSPVPAGGPNTRWQKYLTQVFDPSFRELQSRLGRLVELVGRLESIVRAEASLISRSRNKSRRQNSTGSTSSETEDNKDGLDRTSSQDPADNILLPALKLMLSLVLKMEACHTEMGRCVDARNEQYRSVVVGRMNSSASNSSLASATLLSRAGTNASQMTVGENTTGSNSPATINHNNMIRISAPAVDSSALDEHFSASARSSRVAASHAALQRLRYAWSVIVDAGVTPGLEATSVEISRIGRAVAITLQEGDELRLGRRKSDIPAPLSVTGHSTSSLAAEKQAQMEGLKGAVKIRLTALAKLAAGLVDVLENVERVLNEAEFRVWVESRASGVYKRKNSSTKTPKLGLDSAAPSATSSPSGPDTSNGRGKVVEGSGDVVTASALSSPTMSPPTLLLSRKKAEDEKIQRDMADIRTLVQKDVQVVFGLAERLGDAGGSGSNPIVQKGDDGSEEGDKSVTVDLDVANANLNALGIAWSW